MIQAQRPSPHSQRRPKASSSSSQNQQQRRELAQKYCEDAKRQVSKALSVDERGERMIALELYNKALRTLSAGLGSTRGGDREMRARMERMKEQVKSRMEVLLQEETEARSSARPSAPPLTALTPPPVTSSTAATCTSQSSVTATAASRRGDSHVGAKADLLFNVDSGIGLFQVDNKEHVVQYEDADTFSIFRYREKIEGQPPAFLQCGVFVYPLVPGKSPVFKASERTYMFPELRNEDGGSVGIVLESASEEELSELETLLSQLALLRTSDLQTQEKEQQRTETVEEGDKDKPTWGTTVAGGIDKGVVWVSSKIAQGTEVAGSYISQGATKLRERIEPNEKPTEIPKTVQTGVKVSRKATGYVVIVSDFLMVSLAKLTVAAGKKVQSAVAESDMVKETEVNPHAKEAWKVTKSSAKGAAIVFTDLERGAVALLRVLGEEASKTVEHKYGEDAGKVTDDSLHTAANVTNLVATYWSWKTWGIRFLGKVASVVRDQEKSSAQKTAEASASNR